MIDQIATISTNNDPVLGKIIADAFRSVDNTGGSYDGNSFRW